MILLYIDPGTGSMLITIVIGLFSILVFGFQKLRLKLKGMLQKGGQKVEDSGYMPYVIFTDSKRYWNLFEPICDEFEKRETPIVYWTCAEDDPALKREYKYVKCEYIGTINRAVARLNVMSAGICLSTTPGLQVYQWKRSRNVKKYVHITHAVGDVSLYRMFGLDFYDAVLIAGKYQEDQIRSLEEEHNRPPKELKMVGIPYLDTMFLKHQQKNKQDNDIPVVLLAPSWGANSIINKFGAKIIEALINTGYKLIIRPHPQSMIVDKAFMDSLMHEYPEDEKLTWDFTNNNFDTLRKADIMISDFSGVIFDFAFVFDKPVIYSETEFDTAVYDAAWIDNPIWILETLPKMGYPLTEASIPDIKGIIDRALTSSELEEGRNRAIGEAWERRGESVRLTVDYLIETEEAV